MGYASDAGKNPETEQHKHTYTQPIYAKVHHEEIGHMETVTDPPTYIGTTVPHGRGNSPFDNNHVSIEKDILFQRVPNDSKLWFGVSQL